MDCIFRNKIFRLELETWWCSLLEVFVFWFLSFGCYDLFTISWLVLTTVRTCWSVFAIIYFMTILTAIVTIHNTVVLKTSTMRKTNICFFPFPVDFWAHIHLLQEIDWTAPIPVLKTILFCKRSPSKSFCFKTFSIKGSFKSLCSDWWTSIFIQFF